MKNKDQTSLSSTGTKSVSNKSSLNVSQHKQKIFFLTHGLNIDYKCFDFLTDQLSRSFPNSRIIVSKRIMPEITTWLSMEEQAKIRFKELLKIPDIKEKSIILVGHSAGGLGSCSLAVKCQEKGLHVAGIIGISVPWEGIPKIEVVCKSFTLAELATYLKKIFLDFIHQLLPNSSLDTLDKKMDNIVDILKPILRLEFRRSRGDRGESERGELEELPRAMQDLAPQSKFLCNLKSELAKNNIPILAIGAVLPDDYIITEKKLEDLASLADQDLYPIFERRNSLFHFFFYDIFNALCIPLSSEFNIPLPSLCFNKFITPVIVGSRNSDKRHDMVVPLYSQLGVNVLSQQNKNFQQDPITAFHAPMRVDFFDYQGNKLVDILHSHEMANRVIDFCKRLQ